MRKSPAPGTMGCIILLRTENVNVCISCLKRTFWGCSSVLIISSIYAYTWSSTLRTRRMLDTASEYFRHCWKVSILSSGNSHNATCEQHSITNSSLDGLRALGDSFPPVPVLSAAHQIRQPTHKELFHPAASSYPINVTGTVRKYSIVA